MSPVPLSAPVIPGYIDDLEQRVRRFMSGPSPSDRRNDAPPQVAEHICELVRFDLAGCDGFGVADILVQVIAECKGNLPRLCSAGRSFRWVDGPGGVHELIAPYLVQAVFNRFFPNARCS